MKQHCVPGVLMLLPCLHMLLHTADCQPIHLIPESPLFNSLMMQEHHADELIKRKRLELQTAANPLECPVHKRLRVYIYCTHSHQPVNNCAPQQGSDDTEPPQWTLTMWGRLENPDHPVAAAPPAVGAPAAGMSSRHADIASCSAVPAAGDGSTSAAGGAAASSDKPAAPAVNVGALPPHPSQHGGTKLPFTGFFKRIAIQLDPKQYPDHNTVEWHKAQHRSVAVASTLLQHWDCCVCVGCAFQFVCLPASVSHAVWLLDGDSNLIQ